jgi:class 3 adenylate cyclase
MASTVMVERPNLSGHAAPDGTVSIMFSDIENSTLIIEKLGDLRAQEVFQIHNRAIREQIGKQGGYEVKSMGDGFMVAFSSARRALLCAVEIQRWLATYSKQHPDAPLRVRIGLNTGEAIREAGDFFGKTVVLAARIGAAARGGQILVSATFKAITESAGDIRFDGGLDLNLKGLSGLHRVFGVQWAAVSEQPSKVVESPPDTARRPRPEPAANPRAGADVRVRGRPLEQDRFVLGEVRQPSPPEVGQRDTLRFGRRRRRLRIGLVVLLLFAVSSGIDRWKRYREESATPPTVAPGQPSQPVPARPPESIPESSAPPEPAPPPMAVKPNTPKQGKMVSTENRGEPARALPRSKTTIISSEPPSEDEESASENAQSTGPSPSQCMPTPHRYNIEVSAVSVKSEADAILGRIAELGYKACEKTRTVNGQTQYAVRIGPYNTADEAAAAQEKLHEQYKAAYSEP